MDEIIYSSKTKLIPDSCIGRTCMHIGIDRWTYTITLRWSKFDFNLIFFCHLRNWTEPFAIRQWNHYLFFFFFYSSVRNRIISSYIAYKTHSIYLSINSPVERFLQPKFTWTTLKTLGTVWNFNKFRMRTNYAATVFCFWAWRRY